MKLLHVVGTRPNFVKMAPVIAALRAADPDGRHVLVHTGQHYDRMMSGIFLEQLGVPAPDHMLGVGSGSHAAQLGGVLEAIAPVLTAEQPDLVIVPGDVNSTLAAALACAHLRIPLAHVESGLRSFDRTMPEEVNRVLTDQVSELLFTHSPEAAVNLAAEGIGAERVHLVGNTMIDSLVALEGEFRDARRLRRARPRSRLLPARHAASSGAGRRAAARRCDRRPRRGRGVDAGPLPGPPADPGGARRRGRGVAGRPAADRPGRLPRLPLAGGRRRGGADRLRRHPGGDHLPRRPLLHAARQHRAADHDRARHQPPARARSGADRRPPRARGRRPRRRRSRRRSGTATHRSASPGSSSTGSPPDRSRLSGIRGRLGAAAGGEAAILPNRGQPQLRAQGSCLLRPARRSPARTPSGRPGCCRRCSRTGPTDRRG